METCIIPDKVRFIKNIIFKEDYMILVLKYIIEECKGEIFAATILHH